MLSSARGRVGWEVPGGDRRRQAAGLVRFFAYKCPQTTQGVEPVVRPAPFPLLRRMQPIPAVEAPASIPAAFAPLAQAPGGEWELLLVPATVLASQLQASVGFCARGETLPIFKATIRRRQGGDKEETGEGVGGEGHR
ncbi:MAG: hypothetical protein JO270_04815 [Acidobacteriaceae bacterium]|nr:hypothetical protein [Acidobacteriaceae bacterium]